MFVAGQGVSCAAQSVAQVNSKKKQPATTIDFRENSLAPQLIQTRELVALLTSGLNFTQNRRFEFAVAAAAGAVD